MTDETIHRVLVRVAALPILSVAGTFLLQFVIKIVQSVGIKYWRVYGMVLLTAILAYGQELAFELLLRRSLFDRQPLTLVLAFGARISVIFCFLSILLRMELNIALHRACAVVIIVFVLSFTLVAGALLIVDEFALVWNRAHVEKSGHR
jgi:hypothetical protein